MLIDEEGPQWRENLPEIPTVPLSVQLEHRDKPVSAEVAQARAARAAQGEGQWHLSLVRTHLKYKPVLSGFITS